MEYNKVTHCKKYKSNEINQIIEKTHKNIELLVEYLDYIRNYKTLTDEMLKNVATFDENSKIILIREYNHCMNSLLCIVDDITIEK